MIRGGSPEEALALLHEPGLAVLGGPLGDAARSLDWAELGTQFLHRAGGGDLSGHLQTLGELRSSLDRVLVAVATEAESRGLPDEAGLSLYDWALAQCPWAAPAEVGDLVRVVKACADPAHAPIRDALATGGLPVRRAAKVLRALQRVKPATEPEVYEQDVQILLGAASRPEFTDRDLQAVTDKLIAVALPAREAKAREQAVRESRGVHESSLADGSLVRFVVTCEPEGAAYFRQVMSSPLAAPAPDAEGPDPRTPTQRRYDALIAVLGRGVGAPAGSPGTAKAKLMLLVGLDDLTDMLLGDGSTLDGRHLTPTVVRKLACQADLVPMILGKDGELLETVTPTRYATEKQLLGLYRRDGHCSFPGCSVPPQWCDAHHVIWWSRGGKTCLLNLALLCGRHHTIVHEKDLTATITETGVTWHL